MPIDKNQLENLLSCLARDHEQELTHHKLLRDIQDHRIYVGSAPNEIVRPIQTYLESLPEFDPKHIHSIEFAGGWTRTNAEQLARMTAALVIETGNPKKSAAAVLEFAKGQNIPAIAVLPIHGVRTEKKIKFSNDVELVPLKSLPETRLQRQLLFPTFNQTQQTFFALHAPMALTVRYTAKHPLRVHTSEEGLRNAKAQSRGQLESRLHEVARCLCLAGPSAVIPGFSWHQFEDPVLCRLSPVGGSGRHQEIQPLMIRARDPVDSKLSRHIVKNYANLDRGKRKEIDKGISLLDQALRRLSPEDAAVDLATALELTVGESGGELGYKLGLRSSLIIGGSVDVRIRTRSIVESLYGQRSRYLHGNKPKTSYKLRGVEPIESLSAKELIEEGARICAAILRKYIERGSVPDWRRFEITGGRTWA
ncbi:MAG: HEPN domain-containing protein [Alphaproteobacteria bacterium]